ncbi:Transmembrane and immunoglobulin domain-containing protein 2 [Tupaia chinensis]|nr:Transmembrane and immunoglobulin domain-containing protein 2 [Tupaia chinensis]
MAAHFTGEETEAQDSPSALLQGCLRRSLQQPLRPKVAQTQAWERLRLQWTKDGAVLCEPAVANGSLSGPACGPQGRLSWRPPGALALQLDRVSANDSGHYLCQAAVEIPELEEAEGNATRLLVDAGNALYSNVLYQPRRAPKKTEAWAGQRKVLDARGEDQTGPSAYSDSLPQPGACQPRPDRILALS